MSRILVVADKGEQSKLLDGVVEELELKYGHVVIRENDLITEPFRARRNEWNKLRNFVTERNVDTIITTPFMRNDMPTAPYLLAVTRRTKGLATKKLIRIVLEPNVQCSVAGFSSDLPQWQCCVIEPIDDGITRLAQCIKQSVGERQGRYYFVDDQRNSGLGFLHNVARRIGVEPLSDFFTFDQAYDDLLERNNESPAVIVLDTIENPDGYKTGIGMYRSIHSTILLCEVPIVLFSLKLSRDKELIDSARPMEEPVVLGPNAAQTINELIRG